MAITPLYQSNGGKPIFQNVITPVGVIVHLYHDRPSLDTTDTKPPRPIIDPETGIQSATYKATIIWPKAKLETELAPMREIARQVVSEAWGPDALADPWLNLQPFLRDGDNPEHNTSRREYLFGHYYLNFKQKAKITKHDNGTASYSGAPGLIGAYEEEILPADLYPGCEGRISGIMFGTEYSGKRFVSTRLNNIQRGIPPASGKWERIGGGEGRPDAKTQFGALGERPGTGGLGNIL